MTRPTWSPPIDVALLPTRDPDAHLGMPPGWTGLPLAPHPGAFGVRRKHHVHEGVDVYCAEGTPVRAMEDGRVVWAGPFTGPAAGSPWWLDTAAAMVDGASGAVLYGEVALLPGIAPGREVRRGEPIGHVVRVLCTDKGRPVTMLHIELHAPGTVEPSEWTGEMPVGLRDPTPLLMEAAQRSWNPPGRPAFVKAGDRLVPISAVAGVDIADVEGARVRIALHDGSSLLAEGFDAIEAVMLTRPSALEGRRLRWRRGAWALHNLLAHPAMQVLAWAGFGRLGVRLHDATTPVPRDPGR